MLDVYIGFMDEEVASVLNCLVDRAIAEMRPLLVMERGQVDNALFERHLNSYRQEFSKVVVEGPPVSEDDWAITFANSIQLTFNRELYSKYQQRTHNFVKQKVQLHKPGIAPDQSIFLCSVLGLNTAKLDSKDAIVVIRSPEMGFQPDLTRTYLRAAIRSLQNLPGFRSGANFRVFGAGGAITADDTPGTVHRINTSIFVGSAIAKDTVTNKKYHGVVRFIGFRRSSPNGERKFADLICFQSAGVDSKEQAEQQAKSAFALLCENRRMAQDLIEGHASLNQIETNFDHAVAQQIKSAIREPADGKTSLTASFFIGKRIKALARGLDLHDANMEDYHILKILKSVHEKDHKYGGMRINDVNIVRVDCDPPEIKEETVDAFNKWLASAKYTREKYLAAIKWGLYGAQLPGADCGLKANTDRKRNKELAGLVKLLEWEWARQRQKVQKAEKKLFYEYRHNRLHVILDPFCVEIATDFLKDLNSGRAFDLGQRKIPSAIIDDLQRRVKTLIRVHANSPGDWLPPYLNELLEKLLDGFLVHLCAENGECPFVDKENHEQFKIWIRSGSWKENKSVLSTELKVDESILDRAFYKSANQAALQTHASRIIG